MCQIIVTTPMELLKIQMQDAGRSGENLAATYLQSNWLEISLRRLEFVLFLDQFWRSFWEGGGRGVDGKSVYTFPNNIMSCDETITFDLW